MTKRQTLLFPAACMCGASPGELPVLVDKTGLLTCVSANNCSCPNTRVANVADARLRLEGNLQT